MTKTPPHTEGSELDDDVEQPFDALFTAPVAGDAPKTRREARERAERHGHENPLAWHEHAVVGSDKPKKPRNRRRWLVALIVTVVVLGLLGGAGAFVWNTFQPQVEKLISMTQPTDYPGTGTGSVTVLIKAGDTGGDVATTLQKDGVTKTYDAFYKLLLAKNPAPVFQPGVYSLKKRMSAQAALSALQDPKNKLTRTVVIPEGTAEKSILASVAQATKIPLTELQKTAATPATFGVPAQAKTLEGFLFPATYTFDPGVSAHDAIKTMVDRSFQALDDAGVPVAQRWKTVVLASIVQKEAGPNQSDFGKIARVFQNRLDKGWRLQSDATVAYGTGKTNTVFTTQAERENASNPYNTYAHDGLPVGPIGNPGDVAIKAALHPTPGPWMYFVAVDLKTGETVFSTTAAEHDAAVAKLQRWCAASAANNAYCN
ncbi:MAG TPA: endolytic transglycosylase MltG [Humibacter sp.]|nr:endolytic transglycosylase MltG [Humibacter sp.]